MTCGVLDKANAMIGTSLSHYRIVEKLGGGGMGEVHSEERLRVESWVFCAGRPHQITQRLELVVALEDVDPVSWLQASGQRQNFVCGTIEGMQHEAEFLVFHQREESESDFPGPLDQSLSVGGWAMTGLSLSHCRTGTPIGDRFLARNPGNRTHP